MGPGKFRQPDTYAICFANPDHYQRFTNSDHGKSDADHRQRFTKSDHGQSDADHRQRFTKSDHGESDADPDPNTNDPRWCSAGSGNGSVEQQPVVVE